MGAGVATLRLMSARGDVVSVRDDLHRGGRALGAVLTVGRSG